MEEVMNKRRHESYLLTPGPLTTSDAVKKAMLFDKSPNSPEMVDLVRELRDYLVELAGGSSAYECVPLQGSATYACEAAFHTLIDKSTAKILVIDNGFYGMRLREITEAIGIETVRLEMPVLPPPTGADVERVLDANPGITHLTMCHCDTGTGVLNPLEPIAEVCRRRGVKLMVDAIASFGGFEIDAEALDLEAIFISPNKCLESVPGIAFVICKRASLEASKGRSPSAVLDLYEQWTFMEEKGWFRTTPATHVLLAASKAVELHRDEGGIAARNARYQRNWSRLVNGLRQYGFQTMLPDKYASPIITTFHDPDDPNYAFEAFYDLMEKRGFVIFPGRLTAAHTFRIGTMGDLTESDINLIIEAIMASMEDLGVTNFRPKDDRIIAA
jgi:2-aminoethylphosphonate-pyruvate transaminase